MENPLSPTHEPDPKKLKMSTTTTSDEEDCSAAATEPTADKKRRYKRRKIAIFFAYCGVGYQGMQKNPGAKTIEGDLEEALFLSGAVPEPDRGNPKRFDWARSARTDKGVSAVGQVVSGRFYIDPPGLVDRLNSNLPLQIRIFGYKRVTASFNAKKFCDRRRYVYLIPVFALDPSSHRDRESVLASLGSDGELVKCLECSERGRKVVGVMGRRGSETVVESGISSNSGAARLDARVEESVVLDNLHTESLGEPKIIYDNGDATPHSEPANETNETVVQSGILSNDGPATLDARVEEAAVYSDKGNNLHSECVRESKTVMENGNANVYLEPRNEAGVSAKNGTGDGLHVESAISEDNVEVDLDLDDKRMEKTVKGSGFCYGEKEKERFNRILKHYLGTHNFHNFTTRTKAEDPSAHRFIVSFDASTTVTVKGIEFVKCEVVGQSFMLHQIRKMIGLAVAIMRNCAPESLLETALQKDININVPTAPEVGLYLDECLFTSYNQKWKESHEELSMKAYEEEAEDFKMKYIYSHIASTEHKEGVVALWLHSLNHRNYPDLRVVNNGDTNGGKSVEAKGMAE
ncbi:uncharacterized protein LOC131162152 [Malania oleifera]|uniref:uncharacterized protein LOC131162152 n=1 Tax=Malania oleifera TaxID=397392 RepID=UPI0025AE04C7|nr:uncharacterized protein LOC131162152 [Malania oleifera]